MRPAAAAVLGLAAALCLAAQGEEAGLARLLPLTPAETTLLCAAREGGRLLERAPAVVEAVWRAGGSADPAVDAKRLIADAKALALGAGVAAWSERTGWTMALEVKGAAADVAARLQGYGGVSDLREMWVLRPPRGRAPLYGALRRGVLLLSPEVARVRAFMEDRAHPGFAPAAPAPQWLDSPESRAADLLVWQSGGALWKMLLDPPAGAAARRWRAVFGLTPESAQPMLICLRQGEGELRADVLAAMPPATPGPAGEARPARAVVPPALPSGGGLRIAASGLPPAALLDEIASAETRFDPDAGREFVEELAELNRDLGFDFRKELAGRLGDWALSVAPSEEGAPVWGAAARLDAAEEFLACARRLAEFAEAGWAEAPERKDERRFTSSAFGLALHLAVRPGWFVVASSPEESGRLADWTAADAVSPTATADVWGIDARIDLDALGPLAVQCLPLRRAPAWLGAFPPGSALRLSLRRSERQWTALLRLSGVGLDQLSALLAPRPEDPKPAKGRPK
jgi:hypothetical protein